MEKAVIAIGVSGHQYMGDDITVQFVIHEFCNLLLAYQQANYDVILYSALAPGADQIFVRTALELSIAVELVIPCAEYEHIFLTEKSQADYTYLLSQSRAVHRLPFQICSNDTYLAAGQWIVDHCDLLVLAWNGRPPKGRGGTGDVAHYARLVQRPFVHLHTQELSIKRYGQLYSHHEPLHFVAPKQEFTVAKQTVYQGQTLVVNQYHLRLPTGTVLVRDIVERPESVLVLPLGDENMVLLIEEYDLGAGVWQLTLPGGKVEDTTQEGIRMQAQKELRQEIGYRAGRLDKLVDLYSHPGYVAHKVHLFVARDLQWDPLEKDAQEELRVRTYTLQEALAETSVDYRCDPEAALALLLYAGITTNTEC